MADRLARSLDPARRRALGAADDPRMEIGGQAPRAAALASVTDAVQRCIQTRREVAEVGVEVRANGNAERPRPPPYVGAGPRIERAVRGDAHAEADAPYVETYRFRPAPIAGVLVVRRPTPRALARQHAEAAPPPAPDAAAQRPAPSVEVIDAFDQCDRLGSFGLQESDVGLDGERLTSAAMLLAVPAPILHGIRAPRAHRRRRHGRGVACARQGRRGFEKTVVIKRVLPRS
jgi:hypothetical protein